MSPPLTIRDRVKSIRLGYARLVEPSEIGLPRIQILLAFPALLVLAGVLLISTGINGSSSGAYYGQVFEGEDPALIAGQPQAIRSDEWNILTSWSISQVEQGLPERSGTFPGGMDAGIPQDLPRNSWDVAFRPHLIGHLFLDVDQAVAWRWWLPALALLGAAYCFLVSVIPRRPGAAALISVGFFYSPFFQWWFLPGTFWPAAWALATMAAMVWAFADSSWKSRWIWAIVVSYLTIVMGMGLYVPFIIPAALVIPFFAAGLLVDRIRRGEQWLKVTRRVTPILLAAVVAAIVVGLWLNSKLKTVDAFLGTDYPGERLFATGSGTVLSLARAIGSSFSEALNRVGGFLSMNSSEASTFFFIGAFLLPIVGWIIWRQARTKKRLPWELLGLTTVVAVFAAFVFLPGWDAIAHLLYLDRTVDTRLRLGLGVASLGLLAYVIRYVDDSARKVPGILASVTALLFLLSQAAIAGAIYIERGIEQLATSAPFWWVFALFSAFAIFFFSRGRALLGAIAFAVVMVLSTIAVNPVYQGVFDLRETNVSEAVMEIDDADPGAWVGIGTPLVTSILLQSGVEAYNGLQGAPSEVMWEQIDPAQKYRFAWNRLGVVNWVAEEGEMPRVFNPGPDQVVVTFDACSEFAQAHVEYVLTNAIELPSMCLTEVQSFALSDSTMAIYEVTSESRARAQP